MPNISKERGVLTIPIMKFTQETISEKLSGIQQSFPVLNDM